MFTNHIQLQLHLLKLLKNLLKFYKNLRLGKIFAKNDKYNNNVQLWRFVFN